MRVHQRSISAVSRLSSSLARIALESPADAATATAAACARHSAQCAASPAPASAWSLSFARGARTRPKLSVVLTAELEGLGFAGDVVKVPAGFARNKLIPQGKALPALPRFLRQVQEAKQQGGGGEGGEAGGVGVAHIATREAAAGAGLSVAGGGVGGGRGEEKTGEEDASVVVTMEERMKEAEEIARRLSSQRLSIRGVTPKRSNELRQPITQRHIISEVHRQFGIQLAPPNVPLPSPISSIGDFDVPLRFPPSVALPGEREHIQLAVRVRRA